MTRRTTGAAPTAPKPRAGAVAGRAAAAPALAARTMPVYRVVRRGERAFLYSAATDQVYPLAAEALAAIERAGLDGERLREMELAAGAAPFGLPPPPGRDAVRAEVEDGLGHKVQQIVLAVTESCNLSCQYCVYSGNFSGPRKRSPARMAWPVARKAIDHLLRSCSESPMAPALAFYGGEPLLELELLRRCAGYARERSGGAARFVITTNGTLLDGRARAFLREYDFTVLVSLDGPAEVHDRRRRDAHGRPTFARIMANLAALKDEAPAYFPDRVRFSVVLAPPVDYTLLDRFFNDTGAPCVVSPLDSYGLRTHWHLRWPPPDFEVLAAALERDCRSNAGAELWRRFSVGLLGPSLRRLQSRCQRPPTAFSRLGQCIPGVRKVLIDPRGDMYPCEKAEGGPDVLIGHVDRGVSADAVERLLQRFARTVAHRCGDCWMRLMCSACLSDLIHGGRFVPRKMRLRCAARRRAQADVLGLYAAMLAQDPHALDFLPAAFPWG